MARVTRKYESEAGTIIRIKLDSAKAAITSNTEPTGAVDDPQLFASVSRPGNRRRLGLQARGVYFSRVGTGADLNKVFRVFIPCLTPAAFNTIAALSSLSYKGNTYTDPFPIGES